MYSISFLVIYIYYEVHFQPRGVGSRLWMLVLTGGEERPHGNCGHNMQGYLTWCSTLVFFGYISVSTLSQLLIIRLRIQGRSAIISEAGLLRLQVKWLYQWAQLTVCLSVCLSGHPIWMSFIMWYVFKLVKNFASIQKMHATKEAKARFDSCCDLLKKTSLNIIR